MKFRQRFSSKIFAFMLAIALGAVALSNLVFYQLVQRELISSLAEEATRFALEAAGSLHSEVQHGCN